MNQGLAWLLAAVAVAAMGLAAGPAMAQGGAEAGTRKVVMQAPEAFEKGMEASGLRHDLQGGVVLYDAAIIDDDGVAGGGGDVPYTNADERSPGFPVDAGSQIKKVLVVERPEALEAVLYCRPGKAEVLFNGQPLSGDKFLKVPAALIKKGENEVILRAKGEANSVVKLMLRSQILENAPELKSKAPRSFQSKDGGKTWQPVDGEFTIRLNLMQYAPEGSFLSPWIDASVTDAASLPLNWFDIRGIKVAPEFDAPKGTSVEMFVRTNSEPVYGKGAWAWLPAGEGKLVKPEGSATQLGDRFVQWKAVLKTTDPRVTPVLKKVTLEAQGRTFGADWLKKVAVKAFHNEEIRFTSMPFTYEDPANPRMKALREKYKLDDVVKDGKTELEKFVLLRHWVGKQWKFKGPEGHYPAWDADEIMTRKTGMCCQYAMTLIQCAIALGHQARYVCGYHEGLGGNMGTAHEVTEIWSNQFGKWVFMDPTTAANEYAADPKTGTPLSMLELHDRMIQHFYGDKPATWQNRPKDGTWSGNIALVRGLDGNMQIRGEGEAVPRSKAKPDVPVWPSWTKWRMICWVPRNDWYAKPNALPRLQGWNNWDWTGFWQWSDDKVERDKRYGFFSSRRSDVEWTINQVRFAAAAAGDNKPGTLTIQMGTVTPYFETYVVNVDGTKWNPIPSAAVIPGSPSRATFIWALKPGKNRLEMRVRNTAGVEGPISFLEVEYK